jgi:hypothetical protein
LDPELSGHPQVRGKNRMNLRYSLGAVAVGLVVVGCGLGDDADIGKDSTNQPIGTAGTGGEGAGGASQNAGGATRSTGAVYGAGGASHNTGGTSQNAGGVSHGTGGVSQNTGGVVASGGASQNTGGSTGGGVACGKTTCSANQICCSASCGICGPRGGLCPAIACVPDPVPPGDGGTCVQNVACIKGTSWSPTACKCVPEGGACTTVSDCHLTADYCGGCNCLALSKGESAPACTGTTVQCLIDPCQTKSLACVAGHCVAQ